MDGSRSKALLTSLILFIVLGLYSLTTLFTVLILDLRSGQDEIVHQLSTLPSPPPPSVLDQTHRDDLNLNKLEEMIAYLQATVDILLDDPPQADPDPDFSEAQQLITNQLGIISQTLQKNHDQQQQHNSRLTEQIERLTSSTTSRKLDADMELVIDRLTLIKDRQIQQRTSLTELDMLVQHTMRSQERMMALFEQHADGAVNGEQLVLLLQQQKQLLRSQQQMDQLLQDMYTSLTPIESASSDQQPSDTETAKDYFTRISDQQAQQQTMLSQLHEMVQQSLQGQQSISEMLPRSNEVVDNEQIRQLQEQQTQQDAMLGQLHEQIQQALQSQQTTLNPPPQSEGVTDEAQLDILQEHQALLLKQQKQLLSSQKQMRQSLSRIDTTQQQQLQEQQPSTPDHDREMQEKIDRQLLQLIRQLRGISSSQQEIKALNIKQMETSTANSTASPSSTQFEQINRRLDNLTTLVNNLSSRLSAPQQPTSSPDQVRQLQQQLERLSQQQRESERKRMNSVPHSNTIRPYSYNAR